MDEAGSSSTQPPKPGNDSEVKKPISKRKPHRKSRTGCKQCRASRVKCNEDKPSCSYCIRHSVECSFLTAEPTLQSNISALNLASRTGSPARRPSEALTGGSPHSESSHSQALCSNLHLQDLELLLHFTTSTAYSISSQNHSEDSLWTTDIPLIGIEHPFLMHGIMSISALHLSHLQPSKREEYAILATTHQNIALPVFRAESVDMTVRNCSAVFAFAALLVVYAMASPNQSGGLFLAEPESSGSGLPEWIHLLRGVQAIINPHQELLTSSPLAPLIDYNRFAHRALPHADEMRLGLLSNLFVVSNEADCPPARLAELEIYRRALAALHCSFAIPIPVADVDHNHDNTRQEAYLWFGVVPEEFVTLLSARRPEALVLLAHQCVLLHRCQPCWFVDGVAARLMRTVVDNLAPEWTFWIAWPLQEMGFE